MSGRRTLRSPLPPRCRCAESDVDKEPVSLTEPIKDDLDSSRAITTRVLRNMKILAEGGTLPPPARPAGR